MIRVFFQLMYHRFNENKYPSTNIKMEIFKKQIELIKIKKLILLTQMIFKKF